MANIIKTSQAYCKKNGIRLTDTREQVLSIVSKASQPITAYEILEELKSYVENPKPPIVYRATAFWQEHGFIHKIESINAFVICSEGHRHQGSQFLICTICKKVTEIHACSLPKPFQNAVNKNEFKMRYWNMEIHGQCQVCAS